MRRESPFLRIQTGLKLMLFFEIQKQVDGMALGVAVPERDYSLSCAKASRCRRLASSLRSCMIWT